jgi:putative PIN family toxin of toxin-antitoxin system
MLVFDTNIWVAALTSRNGASFQLLVQATEGKLRFAVSVALVLEYESVLKREILRDASWATENELELILNQLVSKALHVMPIRTRLRPSLQDANDEMVLECAVQSGADSIVTMNRRDFETAALAYRIDIESPGQCLSRIRKEDLS